MFGGETSVFGGVPGGNEVIYTIANEQISIEPPRLKAVRG